MSGGYPDTVASVTIGALGYRARCTEAGCGNQARPGFRYADAGGRPMTKLVFCHRHGRLRVGAIARRGSRSTTIAKVRNRFNRRSAERAGPADRPDDSINLRARIS
jgi:hypothetical protein